MRKFAVLMLGSGTPQNTAVVKNGLPGTLKGAELLIQDFIPSSWSAIKGTPKPGDEQLYRLVDYTCVALASDGELMFVVHCWPFSVATRPYGRFAAEVITAVEFALIPGNQRISLVAHRDRG